MKDRLRPIDETIGTPTQDNCGDDCTRGDYYRKLRRAGSDTFARAPAALGFTDDILDHCPGKFVRTSTDTEGNTRIERICGAALQHPEIIKHIGQFCSGSIISSSPNIQDAPYCQDS